MNCVWKLLSRVWLFATPWIVACQTPVSMKFSRPGKLSGSRLHSPGDLLNSGIEPRSPTLQTNSLLSEPPVKPIVNNKVSIFLWTKLGYTPVQQICCRALSKENGQLMLKPELPHWFQGKGFKGSVKEGTILGLVDVKVKFQHLSLSIFNFRVSVLAVSSFHLVGVCFLKQKTFTSKYGDISSCIWFQYWFINC